MAGHSVLYIGRSNFAPEFLQRLQDDEACSRLTRCESVQSFAGVPAKIDLILFETASGMARTTETTQSINESLGSYPLIALIDQGHSNWVFYGCAFALLAALAAAVAARAKGP